MDFNLITIIALACALVVGAFLGIMLGRRSKTANSYADRIQAKLSQAEKYILELEEKIKKGD